MRTMVLGVGLIAVGFGGWGAERELRAAPSQWTEKMREMAPLVKSLTVELSDTKGLEQKETRERVAKDAAKLAELAHSLPEMRASSPDTDPTIGLLAAGLAEETGRAARAFRTGQPAYARYLLRGVTGYCITCHSRAPGGEAILSGEADKRVQSLAPLERAHLFAATRRFEPAVTEYEKVLESAPARGPEWEEALRSSLAIAVRVKEDPVRTRALIERALKSGGASDSLKAAARGWQKSVLEWIAESKGGQDAQPEALLQSARTWMARGEKLQSFPLDRAGMVAYLRAAGLLHRYLRTRPQGEKLGQALELLARAQQPLGELPMAELPQLYYSACVRVVPHSPLALKCYQGYEEEVRAGFTGSGGTDIPPEEMDRLSSLKKMAQPESPGKPRKKL